MKQLRGKTETTVISKNPEKTQGCGLGGGGFRRGLGLCSGHRHPEKALEGWGPGA